MKYIAIFEDTKGFTRVAEFALLPHKYDFIERPVPTAFFKEPTITSTQLVDKKITFVPTGEPQEVYGQIIQKYYQQ